MLDALVVVLCPKSSRISPSSVEDVLCLVGFTPDGKILAVNVIIAELRCKLLSSIGTKSFDQHVPVM